MYDRRVFKYILPHLTLLHSHLDPAINAKGKTAKTSLNCEIAWNDMTMSKKISGSKKVVATHNN